MPCRALTPCCCFTKSNYYAFFLYEPQTNADNAKTAPAKKAAAKPAAAASDAAKGRKRTAAAMTEEARPAKRPATRGGATRGRAASVPPASITAPIAVPTPAVAQAIAFTAAPATMIGGVMRPAGKQPH